MGEFIRIIVDLAHDCRVSSYIYDITPCKTYIIGDKSMKGHHEERSEYAV